MTVKAFRKSTENELEFYQQRCELACASCWAVRHDFREVAVCRT